MRHGRYSPADIARDTAQRKEAFFLAKFEDAVKQLSEIEALLDTLKRRAGDEGIDINKAAINTTQEHIPGAESETQLSLRRRRAIGFGVLVMSHSSSNLSREG